MARGHHKDKRQYEVQLDKQPLQNRIKNNTRSFGFVNIKYIIFGNVKSVIFTKPESNPSQKRVHLRYQIDTGSNTNLMQFKVFKIIFPKSTLAVLHTT